MVRKHDIRTVCKVTLSCVPTNLGLGVVPNGMKRWVTFVRVQNEASAVSRFLIGSGTTATHVTMANAKFCHYCAGGTYEIFESPDSPNPDKPLFSIDANRYLTAYASTTSISIFVQYYDE